MAKALFLDIDGTLVSFRTHEVPASTTEALADAKAAGHHIFIATGRPRVLINNLDTLQKRKLIDGYVTMNGAYCFVGEEIIYKGPICESDVRRLTAYCFERNIPCIVVGEHTLSVCQPDERVRLIFNEYLKVTVPMPASTVDEAILGKEIFQLTPFINTNEEKEIEVVFPKDYPHEDLKGKKVTFNVKVNEIKEKIQREFDKELFEDLAIEGVDSKEKLEKHIENTIREQKEMENENKYVDSLLEAVAKNVEVDIPEEMVEEEIDRLINRYEEQLKMQGISLEMYYQFTKTTEKELRANMEKEAYNHVLYRLMLEEIANIEKIEISDDEAQKEAEELAKKYQMKKDDFIKMFGGSEMVQYDLEIRKVIELLKEYNK